MEYTLQPTKMLGIWISKDVSETLNINYENCLAKLRNLINMWKQRQLTIKGKITILKNQALPLILYVCSVLLTPKQIINEIDKIFYNFIWPKEKNHVQKKVLINEIDHGGLNMPDIEAIIKSFKMDWIKRLLSKNNNYTKLVSAVSQGNFSDINMMSNSTINA